MKKLKYVFVLALAMTVFGCSNVLDNSGGRATIYEDASTTSQSVSGLGIESQDIIAVSDKMARDILSSSELINRKHAPRIIVDSEYFINESASTINKNMLTDRLRIGLNRASHGRLVFVGRHYADMVSKERTLKRTGVVDAGTIRHTKATAGADFRLGGRISSLDAMSTSSQTKSRYTQITFELVDLEYGTIIWSDIYEFKKSARDDVVYR